MTKEAMSMVRVHGARYHEVGVMFVFVALLACSVGEVVAKKARHPEPQTFSGKGIEALLPPALLGDWSALLGDGIPGMAVRDDEMLVAWVRPHTGMIEIRLLHDDGIELSQCLPAERAYGIPVVEATESGWFVGWTAEGNSLRVSLLDDRLFSLREFGLGDGVIVASVSVGQTVHLIALEDSDEIAVWSISIDSLGGVGLQVLAFPDGPSPIDIDPETQLSGEHHVIPSVGGVGRPQGSAWQGEGTSEVDLLIEPEHRALAIIQIPTPIDLPSTISRSGGLFTRTRLRGEPHRVQADWSALSIFATPPCEVVDGPNVTLAWELPGPDAGAISLEFDEAGVVSGFDLLTGIPRLCGERVGNGRRHEPACLVSSHAVESLVPPAIRGDWSLLLGDGFPGSTIRGTETLVAWVRPFTGTIEVRLLREGELTRSRSLTALFAYGTPSVEATPSGWFVGWTGEGHSVRVRALDSDMLPSNPIDLGQGLVLATAVTGQTVHVIADDDLLGPVVRSLAIEHADRPRPVLRAFRDAPAKTTRPSARAEIGGGAGLPTAGVSGPAFSPGLPVSGTCQVRILADSFLEIPSHFSLPSSKVSHVPGVPPIIPIPESRFNRGGHLSTIGQGGSGPGAAAWPVLSIFATEPCEVVHGPNVTLAWELPAPDAGAISLELDEAGVVSGFDLLPGLPRSCGKSRGPRSSGR